MLSALTPWRWRRQRNRPWRLTNRTQARRRLRLLVLGALCCAALPLALLLSRVYTHLAREVGYQYRNAAQDTLTRLNQRLVEILLAEDKRAFDEYSFLNISNRPLLQSTTVTTSPLAALPSHSPIPGLVGYFQLNPDGSVQSPVLPELSATELSTNTARFGFEAPELQKRLRLRQRLEEILVSGTPRRTAKRAAALPEAAPEKRPIDRLTQQASADKRELQEERDQKPAALLTKLKDQERRDTNAAGLARSMPLDAPATPRGEASKSLENKAPASRSSRKEQVTIPEQSTASQVQGALESLNALPAAGASGAGANEAPRQTGPATREQYGRGRESQVKKRPSAIPLLTFESEVDPLQGAVLPSGHLVFFRKAWRDNLRYIQGFIVETSAFLQPLLIASRGSGRLGQVATLTVSAQDSALLTLPPPAPAPAGGETLYRASLDAPLDALEVAFSLLHLPRSPGAMVVDGLAITLACVLLAGHYGLYRVGRQHIALAAQRSDFVSAVSHELKTPLTSIRMYGEMLRAGWVSDETRRQTYYDFIFFESERLSRLISNVLHLARLTNHDEPVTLQPYSLPQMLDVVRSKVSTQVEAAGFTLVLSEPLPDVAPMEATVLVEEDALVQIVINLVDNALKFSAQATPKRLDVGLRLLTGRTPQAVLSVRDYGPGIDPDQMARIFHLFYRGENAVARATPGTGIGLALVKALATQMQAQVEVENRQPGAEFRLLLPVVRHEKA